MVLQRLAPHSTVVFLLNIIVIEDNKNMLNLFFSLVYRRICVFSASK